MARIFPLAEKKLKASPRHSHQECLTKHALHAGVYASARPLPIPVYLCRLRCAVKADWPLQEAEFALRSEFSHRVAVGQQMRTSPE